MSKASVGSEVEQKTKPGYRLVSGQDAYYRFSDITFEWHKKLTRLQMNAVKSLISNEALTSKDHPLRQNHGEEQGVVFDLGLCKDGKPRLLISFKQVEYLRYWIQKMKLVKGDDSYIPLPGIASLIRREDLDDIEPCLLKDSAYTKKALSRPAQVWKDLKKAREPKIVTVPAEPSVNSELSSAEAPTVQDDSVYTSSDIASMAKEQVESYMKSMEMGQVDDADLHDEQDETGTSTPTPVSGQNTPPPQAELEGPMNTYYHAEQAYIIASDGGRPPIYHPGTAPCEKDMRLAGKGAFLSLDLSTREGRDDIVLDFGWATTWFEEDKNGDWLERKEQGHWIINDHIINGDIVADERSEYLFERSEFIWLEEFKDRLVALFNDIKNHSEPNAGPLYLIIHSAEKDLDHLAPLGLPTQNYFTSLYPEGFAAAAYATKESDGKVFVVDTSELVVALGGEKKRDMTLQELSERFLDGSGEEIAGFGNSGNDAYYIMESFLTMVYWKYDIAKICINAEKPVSAQPTKINAVQDNHEEVEYYEKQMLGVGLEPEEVEFNTRELDLEIGPGGPENDDEF